MNKHLFSLVWLMLLFCGSSATAQTRFAISPTTVSPNVGDTVRLDINVTDFDTLVSFQYTMEWDSTKFRFVSVTDFSIPSTGGFQTNSDRADRVVFSWNSTSNSTVADGSRIYRLNLRAIAPATNYFTKFSGSSTPIEVIQRINGVDTDVTSSTTFTPLGDPNSPSGGGGGGTTGTRSSPLKVAMTTKTAAANEAFCMDVTTQDFVSVQSMQWAMKWDSSVIRLDSVSAYNSSIGIGASNFGTTQAISNGILYFGWNSPTDSSTLTNDAVLFRLCFKNIASTNKSTNINFIGASGTPIEVIKTGGSVPLTATAGTVNATGNGVVPSNQLTIYASNQTVNVGDTACIRVRANKWVNIASAQWSMVYDSLKFQFVSTRNLNTTLDGATFGTPKKNTVNFVWISNTGSNVTIADSATLFEVCLKTLGGNGTKDTFRFDSIPVKFEIRDENGVKIPFTFLNGVTTIGSVAPVGVSGVVTNVDCNGRSTGGINLTASGGNGTFVYSWSNGATTEDISNLVAGKYKVTVTSGGNTKIDSFTITEPTAVAMGTPAVTNINCNGGNGGAINISVSGGTSPYTFAWAGPSGFVATTEDISSLRAGNYTVTITDNKSCALTSSAIAVTEPAALTIATPSVVNARCGLATGSIDITSIGGTSPYTYSWSNGTTTQDLQNIFGGNYIVTITDSKSCIFISNTIVVTDTVSTVNIGTPTVTNSVCGQASGAINITPTGGVSPYTFRWSNNATTEDISNLQAGAYFVTVTDARNCDFISTAITVNNTDVTISAQTAITSVKCFNGNDGAINITPSGGRSPYTFRWSNNATTQNIGTLTAGNYVVTITDADGCTFTSNSLSVTQPNVIAFGTPTITNVACSGDSSGAIVPSISGGSTPYTFRWAGPNGFSSTSQNISNLKVGAYTLKVIDNNNCSQVSPTYNITGVSNPISAQTNSTNVLCFGDATGSIGVTPSGGVSPYTFAWTGSNSYTSSQANNNGVRAGTYNVTVQDANGCLFSQTGIIVTQPSTALTIANVQITNANGANNGAIDLTTTGGTGAYRYAWSGPGVSASAEDQNNLAPGTYSVTVSDANNCSVSRNITVGGTGAAIISIQSSKVTNAGCPGQRNGAIEISFSGGQSPYTFDWRLTSNNTQVGSTQNIGNLPQGSYTVKILDGSGQVFTSQPFTVQESAANINISSIVSPETCAGNDGRIDVTVSGGNGVFAYRWSDIPDNIQDRFNIKRGTYTLIITDGNGCIAEHRPDSVKYQPCLLTSQFTKKDVACFNKKTGSVNVVIQGGDAPYTLRWSTGGSAVVNNAPQRGGTYEITNLAAGSFTVTVTDANNQNFQIATTISQPDSIVILPTVTPDNGSCNGNITISVSGGVPAYSFRWNTGEISRDLTNLCGNTTHSVMVTDANGCVQPSQNITVTSNATNLTVSGTQITPSTCQNDASGKIDIEVSGGAAPYAYLWKDEAGVTLATTQDLNGLKVGRYFVTITDNSRPQRMIIQSFTVTSSSTLNITSVTTGNASTTTSTDGSATVTVSGGVSPYSYRWCDGTTTTTNTRNNLVQGACSVTVTDAQGCEATRSFTVAFGSALTIRQLSNYNGFGVACANGRNGSAAVTAVSGGTSPYTYIWSNNETNSTATTLPVGVTTVTVTDATGKRFTGQIELNAPQALVFNILTTAETAAGSDGTATLQVAGGVAPYTYLWDINTNRQNTATADSLKVGNYTAIVTDANNCAIMAQARVDGDSATFCLQGSKVITPAGIGSGDGENDFFKVGQCDFTQIKVKIYNRYGQLVYEDDNYDDEWEGQDKNGVALPSGGYFYILEGLSSKGLIEQRRGSVTIIREQ